MLPFTDLPGQDSRPRLDPLDDPLPVVAGPHQHPVSRRDHGPSVNRHVPQHLTDGTFKHASLTQVDQAARSPGTQHPAGTQETGLQLLLDLGL